MLDDEGLEGYEDETLQEADQLLADGELELLEGSLFEFMEAAWPTIEPAKTFHANWHLEAIAEHLQAATAGQIQKLVINIPPRHLKSKTVQVFWPAWVWAKKPEVQWFCVAYNKNLVIRDATICRRLIRSPWYQRRWGNKFSFSEDQNVKFHYANDKGGVRLIGSFEGGVTGEGGDILVIDDPTQLEDANNQAALESAAEVYDGALSTRLNDPSTAIRVLIMQRLNENDLTGHVLKEGGWCHLYLPAMYEPNRRCFTYIDKDVDEFSGQPKLDAEPFFADPRKVEGELLDPGRYPPKEIASLQAKGEVHFAGQQQQRPVPAAGNIFKKAWFKHYINVPQGLDILADACQSWDCSFKDEKSSSYVVCTVWARKRTDIYLLYRLRRKMDLPATLKAVESVTSMFPWIGAKYIEEKANGPAVISSLKNKISGLIAVPNNGGAVPLAHSITYLYEAGNVWHPDPDHHRWVKEYEDEHTAFPNGAYTDQVVSGSQGLFWHFHKHPPTEVTLLDLLTVGKGESMAVGNPSWVM